jgi:hypothetical protein
MFMNDSSAEEEDIPPYLDDELSEDVTQFLTDKVSECRHGSGGTALTLSGLRRWMG